MTEQVHEPPATSPAGCVVRIFWAILGPGLVGAVGFILILNKPPMGSALDFVLLAGLILLIAARLIDSASGTALPGSTDIGRTARRKYIVGVVVFGALVFVIAHVVAPRLFQERP